MGGAILAPPPQPRDEAVTKIVVLVKGGKVYEVWSNSADVEVLVADEDVEGGGAVALGPLGEEFTPTELTPEVAEDTVEEFFEAAKRAEEPDGDDEGGHDRD